jgi:hypothetical protein
VFYLLVAVLIGTAIMQIKYINRALQRFDATQVIPVQFVLFTLSVIGGSAILYRDFERTSGEDAGKFVGGCALTFFGVWLITSGRPSRHDHDDEDREPEPEDAINLVGERYTDEVDGTDGTTAAARQSSTLQAASPRTAPRYRDEEDFRPTTPNIQITPDPTLPRPHGDRPATADVLSSLMANPWTQDHESNTHQTPALNRHTSTPVLPSEAAPPPLASSSDPELVYPRTPTRGKSQNEVPTTPGSQLRRMRTGERMNRNSIAGPLLASPLSTTLSAMVQDLKRGGSTRQREVDGSVRRPSVLGIGAGEVDGSLMGESLSRRQTQTSLAPSSEQAATLSGRARSLSGTLNDLWRGLRGSNSYEDIGGEEARQ